MFKTNKQKTTKNPQTHNLKTSKSGLGHAGYHFQISFFQHKEEHFSLPLQLSNTNTNNSASVPNVPKIPNSARLGSQHSLIDTALRKAQSTPVNTPSTVTKGVLLEELSLAEK